MEEKINILLADFNDRLGSVSSSQEVETLRVEFMGKKGQGDRPYGWT